MKVIQILKESSPPDLMKGFEDFLPLAMSVLEIDKLPPIKIVKDVPGSQPSFGGFDQDSGIIFLQITIRHPLDIFRTLAHELVHFKQNSEHKLDGESGLTGSPIENEANATAGIVMRHFNKKYPEYLSHRPLIKEDTSDYEIHNYKKLDRILTMLCKMVIEGQKKDKEYYGMVAACVLDPDNQMVAKVNYPTDDGLRVHAERAAMEAYQAKYGEIPEGSIIVTTLSPCNERSDETADGRAGNNCTDLINHSPVHKVYCGYMDPSQGDEAHNERDFNLMETENGSIRDLCKSFADTFLKTDHSVAEGVPQPGPSSGAPKQFGPDAKIHTRQMTVKQLIASVPGLPYYNNVVDDWDAKDYSWGVTKKVIEYATYLKDHPESLSQLPPILVLNGKFEDGAHRVSAIWLLQQRMDPKNPLWKNAKLDVKFVKQDVAENFADGKNPGRKGLSKRVGVNTKASVSSLRNTAKHSSGEKQRMAHWLANMKAGRAK